MLIFPDFVLQKTIKETLTEIANDEAIIQFLFGQFKEAHLSEIYGQKEIDSLVEFLKKDQIKVVTSWNMIDVKYPSYSIQLLNNEEIDNEALLDDHGIEEFLDADGNVINKNPPIICGDGSGVYPPVIPTHSSKRDVFSTSIREHLMVGCHATEPNIARYMAWLLQFIIRSKKNTLISRGINRISLSFSDFNRMNDLLPENIFTRFANLSLQHFLSFTEDDLLLDDTTGINVIVKGQIQSSTNSPGTTNKSLPSNATFVTIEG